MSLEESIKQLILTLGDATVAINRNTDYMETVNLNYTQAEVGGAAKPSKVAEDKADKEKPKAKKTPVPKTVAKKEPAAPVVTGKPPITFSNLRLKVLAWIGPLAKGDEDDQQRAQDIMTKLLDKYTGGKPFEPDTVPAKYFQNILDYIDVTEAK